MNVKDIRDHTERVWFLGTDLWVHKGELHHGRDLRLMDEGAGVHSNAAHDAEYFPGVFYHISPDDDYFAQQIADWKVAGYSRWFIDIMKEARRREYAWVYFHPDIETENVAELDEDKLTVEELKARYGGSGWDDHPEHDREDWACEADNGDTCVGYWTWVQSQIQMGADD